MNAMAFQLKYVSSCLLVCLILFMFGTHGAASDVRGAKCLVEDAGLYHVDAVQLADLLDATTPVQVTNAIASTNIAITCQGYEVSWLPDPDGSGFHFVGHAMTNNTYTDRNVYLIQLGPGRVMRRGSSATSTVAEAQAVFRQTLHFEEGHTDRQNLFTNTESDVIMWGRVYAGQPTGDLTIPFETPGTAATNQTVDISLRFRQWSDQPAVINDHHTRVYVNTQLVGEVLWDGAGEKTFGWSFPAESGWLHDGTNALQIEGILEPGVSFSVVYLDDFDVTYPRFYLAENDMLLCSAAGHTHVTVHGFSTNAVTVIDVSDPYDPMVLDGARVTATTGGTHAATFAPPDTNGTYLCSSRANAGILVPDPASDLVSTTNTFDCLIITVPRFVEQCRAWRDYRRAQGLKTAVVLFEDICDEFTDGLSTPWAIKRLLAHAASNWRCAPRYVLLVGNGTYDFRDQLEKGDCLVPPLLTYVPGYAVYATDARFADTDDDGTPDLAIGRIPATTTNALAHAFAKTRAYEEAYDSEWRGRVHMVADDPDPNAGDFPSDSDTIAHTIGAGYTVEKTYLDSYAPAVARQRLLDALDDGCTFVNYVGHGSGIGFAGYDDYHNVQQDLLLRGDAAVLDNAANAPVMAVLACGFVRFGVPGYDLVGEELVCSEDGLSAAWGTLCPVYNDDNVVLGRALAEGLFGGYCVRLGDAIVSALAVHEAEGQFAYHREVFGLLGDPALVVASPGYSYETWLPQAFSESDRGNPLIAGRMADPDGDGLVNVVEFATGGDPTNAAGHAFQTWVQADVLSGGRTNDYVYASFAQRKTIEGAGVVLATSSDLRKGSWGSNPNAFAGMKRTSLNDVVETVTVHFAEPLIPGGRVFLRLGVVSSCP